MQDTDYIPPLSLDNTGGPPPLTISDEPVYSDEYLQDKTLKYDYTLGDHSPGKANLLQTARSGLLKKIASNVTAQDKLEDQKTRVQIINNIAEDQKGKPLDPAIYNFVMGLTPEELKQAVNDPLWDANAVYAKKVANEQLNANPYPWEEVFKTKDTEEKYHKNRDIAETHIAWRESLYDVLSELEGKMGSKSYAGQGYEYFEQWVIPFASYFNRRNTVEGDSIGSISLGQNLQEQYQKLWSLPLPERYSLLRKAVDEISDDNLLDAMEFVQGALNYGRQQQELDDIFTVLEVVTTVPIRTVSKLAKGAVKGSKTIINKSTKGVVDAIVKDSNAKKDAMLAKKVQARGRTVRKKSERRVVPEPGEAPMAPRKSSKPKVTPYKKTGLEEVSTEELRKRYDEISGRMVDNYDPYEFTVDDYPGKDLDSKEMMIISTELRRRSGKPDLVDSYENVGNNYRPYKSEVALDDLVQATDPSNPNIVSDTLAATGRSKEGAAVKAQKIAAIETSREPPQTVRGQVERSSVVPTMFDVHASKLPEPPITKITNQLAMRINEAMKKVSGKLDDAVFSSKSIATRFSSDEMMQQAFLVAVADFARLYPKVGDAILDVNMRTPEDTLGDVVEVTTTFGKPDKTLFQKPFHANNYGKKYYDLRKGSFDVIQIGNEYAIRVKTIADESKLSDYLIPTTGENSSPTSLANTFLGYIRTQNDLISTLSSENRKAITHAYSYLQREVKEVADHIAAVGRVPGRMARFERVLNAGLHGKRMVTNTDEITGVTKEMEVVGIEWDMAGFERKYMELNKGRMPSESEFLAYEVYKRILKFDLAIRNLDLYRDKATLGITQWRFKGMIENEKGEVVRGWSNTFDGKLLDDLPYEHPENTFVAIPSETEAFADVFPVKKLSQKNRDYLQKLKDEGYRIIQVANPDALPLENVLKTKRLVNFVIVKEGQTTPLKLAQLPRTQGGHRIPNEGWFLKQARLEKPPNRIKNREGKIEEVESDETFYRGDVTVAGVHAEAKAKEMVPLIEKARQLFKEGNRKAFDEWVERHLPREPNFLWNDFKDGTLDPNQTFYVTKSGQGVNDVEAFRKSTKDIPNFVDAVDSSFNLYRRLNKKFAGEKSPDLMSGSKVGTDEGNPVFRFKTARYIDPLEAMTTSMSSLMRNRAYSDYVIHSTNSWIEEFGDLLNVPKDVLRANPLHHLHNPQWIDKPVARDRLAAAKNSRLAVVNILGTRSDLKNNIEWFKGKAVDFVYNKAGDKASEKFADWVLPTENDPLAFVRKAAFDMTLGMFNPVQIIVQGQTLFHMTAITGNLLRAGSAFVDASLMQMLQMSEDPKIIDHIATIASRSGGGSKDDFLQSFLALKQSGLWYVEGEHGWVDNVLDPNIFENMGTKFLDKGAVFFKGIERFNRLASWNIAFKEWRNANPGKVLTKRSDINKVLARQDLLSNNMTSASSANLQKGIFSIGTQFYGYQMRLLDQMLGKRLTRSEKMRVLGLYSMLYGVPIGAGIGMATPWYQDIIDYAERNGVKTDEGAGQLFFKGALSFLTEFTLNDEYNPGKRYGPGGFEVVKNLLDDGLGQDGLITLMGASTGIFMNAAQWSQPALTGLWSATMDDEKDALPLVTQDFVDAFRSISTVNNGVKAYMAMYYNGYYTRDGRKIATVDDVDALAIGLFGLTPSSVDTMYRQMDFLKESKSATDSLKKEYVKNMRRALRSPNKADRAIYLRRARIMAQSAPIDTRERARWFQEALKGDEELIMQIDKEYRDLNTKIEGIE